MLVDCLGSQSSVGRAGPVMLSLAIMTWAVTSQSALGSDNPPEASVPTPVAVDIRPGLCPNHLRLESPLTIPVAVLGKTDFEVASVDPSSVRLSRDGVAEEVEPLGWTYEDVGGPVIGGLCACHKLRGDGLDDLEFYFSIEAVAESLGLQGHSGDIIPLTLSGKLTTGEYIEGKDCASIIGGRKGSEESEDEIGVLAYTGEQSAGERFRFSYYTTVSDRVTFTIHDVQGRVVAKLIDMDMAPGIYHATWNAKDQDRQLVPTGTYFARVNNSWMSDTKKITLLQ